MTVTVNLTLIAVCIFGIITMVSVCAALRFYRDYKQLHSLLNLMTQHSNDYKEYVEACYNREGAMVDILTGILLDLAHSKDHFAIEWKLMILRAVEDLLTVHGYRKDENIYNLLIDRLDVDPPENLEEFLDILSERVRGYYVMDPVAGENYIFALRALSELNEKVKCKIIESYVSYDALRDLATSINFKLDLVDTRPTTEKDRHDDDWDDIMRLFRVDPDPATESVGDESYEESAKASTDVSPDPTSGDDQPHADGIHGIPVDHIEVEKETEEPVDKASGSNCPEVETTNEDENVQVILSP